MENQNNYDANSYRKKIDELHDTSLVNDMLAKREMTTPNLFIKSTNYSSIRSLYKNCLLPPQFWKIECYLGQDDDCFKYFSYPGYFFESWLKTELERQEKLYEQNKNNKIEKKNNKIERKRIKKELKNLKLINLNSEDTDMLLTVDDEENRLQLQQQHINDQLIDKDDKRIINSINLVKNKFYFFLL